MKEAFFPSESVYPRHKGEVAIKMFVVSKKKITLHLV